MLAWANGAETPASAALLSEARTSATCSALGYIAASSGHSTGAAVDLTLVELAADNSAGFDPGASYADCTAACREACTRRQRRHGHRLRLLRQQPRTPRRDRSRRSSASGGRRWLQRCAGRALSTISKEWWHFSLPGAGRGAFDFPISRAGRNRVNAVRRGQGLPRLATLNSRCRSRNSEPQFSAGCEPSPEEVPHVVCRTCRRPASPAPKMPRTWKFFGTALWGAAAFVAMSIGQIVATLVAVGVFVGGEFNEDSPQGHSPSTARLSQARCWSAAGGAAGAVARHPHRAAFVRVLSGAALADAQGDRATRLLRPRCCSCCWTSSAWLLRAIRCRRISRSPACARRATAG